MVDKNSSVRMGRIAAKVFLYSVMAAFFGLIIHFSLLFVFESVATQNVGYQVYTSDESGYVVLEEHYWAEGEEKIFPEVKAGERLRNLRSEMSPAAEMGMYILSQILTLGLFISFEYNILWGIGNKDRERVNFGRISQDKLKGFKIGAMASIPAVLGYIFLILCKAGIISKKYFALYSIANSVFIPYFRLVTSGAGNIDKVSLLGVLGILAVVVVLPIICGVSYVIGYRQIVVAEKMIYKD